MSSGGPFMYDDEMKPTRNIVLIEADRPKEKTSSGIYIAEDWKTLPQTGTVKALGPEVKNQDLLNKHVVFERYASIKLEGDDRLCQESHILAILDES